MNFQQIRSATIKITYAGKTFLIDPWLAPRFTSGCLAMIPMMCAMNRGGDPRKKYVFDECSTWEAVKPKHKWLPCPLHSLPMSVKEVNEGVDAYICTHVHLDHIGLAPNGKACQGLDKNRPIYAINRQDADYLAFSGMKDVRVIEDRVTWGDAEIIKVNAVHGTKVPCCDAAGFIFRSPNEKTLYVCGDTVWCDDVAETIEKYHPDVIITNNCAGEKRPSDHGRQRSGQGLCSSARSGDHRKPHGQRAARHAHPQDTVQETGEEGHPQSRLHPRRRRELHAVERISSCGIYGNIINSIPDNPPSYSQ